LLDSSVLLSRKERCAIHQATQFGCAPSRSAPSERAHFDWGCWPFRQLSLQNANALFLVRQIKSDMKIETAFADERTVQPVLEICRSHQNDAALLARAVDALHQACCHRVKRPSRASHIITVADLLSFCTESVNFVDKQQCRLISLSFSKHVPDVLLGDSNELV